MARSHFHVHSSLGNGYLCECDYHPPLSAAGRDAALREERDWWRDYAAEDVAGQTHTIIRGSVRAGHFEVTDTLSIAWARYVTSWACSDPECYSAADAS